MRPARALVAHKRREIEAFLAQAPDLEEDIVNTTSPIATRNAKLAELGDKQKEALNSLRSLTATAGQFDAAIAKRSNEDAQTARAANHAKAAALQKEMSPRLRPWAEELKASVQGWRDNLRASQSAVDAANAARPEGAVAIPPIDADRYPVGPPPSRAARTLTKLWATEAGALAPIHQQDMILPIADGQGMWEPDPPGVQRGGTNSNDRFVRREYVRTQWTDFFTGRAPERSAVDIVEAIPALVDELTIRGATEVTESPCRVEYHLATDADCHLPREGAPSTLAAQ